MVLVSDDVANNLTSGQINRMGASNPSGPSSAPSQGVLSPSTPTPQSYQPSVGQGTPSGMGGSGTPQVGMSAQQFTGNPDYNANVIWNGSSWSYNGTPTLMNGAPISAPQGGLTNNGQTFEGRSVTPYQQPTPLYTPPAPVQPTFGQFMQDPFNTPTNGNGVLGGLTNTVSNIGSAVSNAYQSPVVQNVLQGARLQSGGGGVDLNRVGGNTPGGTPSTVLSPAQVYQGVTTSVIPQPVLDYLPSSKYAPVQQIVGGLTSPAGLVTLGTGGGSLATSVGKNVLGAVGGQYGSEIGQTAGNAIGGPIGGTVGSLVGGAIGGTAGYEGPNVIKNIVKGKGVEGPMLGATEGGQSAVTRGQMDDYTKAWLQDYGKGQPGITQELARPDGSGVLIYRDAAGKPVGFAAFTSQAVTDIGVLPTAQRQGVASSILDTLAQRGITEMRGPFTAEGEALARAKGILPNPSPSSNLLGVVGGGRPPSGPNLPSLGDLAGGAASAAKTVAPYALKTGLGAAAGAAIAQETGNDPWKGAAIGAAAGLTFAVGSKLAQTAVDRKLNTAVVNRYADNPDVERTANKLTALIDQAGPVREEQQALYSKELAQRTAKLAKIQQKNTGNLGAELGVLKGPLPKAAFAPVTESFTPAEITNMNKFINTAKDLQPFEKVNAKVALVKTLSGEVPTHSEIDLLGKVFGDGLKKTLLAKRPFGQRAWENAVDFINLPRSLITAFDASAPLRQGAIVSAGHPIASLKAAGAMIKAMASEKFANVVDEAIQQSDNQPAYQKMGLYFSPSGNAQFTRREEQFFSRFAQSLPGISGSQRGFVTYLNKLRQDVADSFIKAHPNATDKELAQFGKWINVATGRGDLPTKLTTGAIANIAFAPRYAASRVEVPFLFVKALAPGTPNSVRMEAARDFVTFVGAAGGLLAAGQYAGVWNVELDPRSTDFGKGKMGNTRFDFWAGEQQIARYATQLITGQRKDSTGRIVDTNRGDIAKRWLQSKEAPIASIAGDVLTGQTFTGQQLGLDKKSIASEIYQHTMPLFLQDVADAATEGGAASPFRAIPSAFGAGVQTYQDSAYVARDKQAVAAFGKHWTDLSPQQQNELKAQQGSAAATYAPSSPAAQESLARRVADTQALQTIQQGVDSQYLGPNNQPKTANDGQSWRDDYHKTVAQQQALYEKDKREHPYDFTSTDPTRMALDERGKIIDQNTVGQTINWDAVDAWSASNPDKQKLIDAYYADPNKPNTDLTPGVTAYKQASQTVGQAGYFDIRDQAWQTFTTNDPSLQQYKDIYAFEDALRAQVLADLKSKGAPDLKAKDIADSVVSGNGLVKAFSTAKNAMETQWVIQNPKAAMVAWQWGYLTPTEKEKAIIEANQ